MRSPEHVRHALANPLADPAIELNWPIRYAAWYGLDEIFKLLLSDPRVDPSAVSKPRINVRGQFWSFNNGTIAACR